jgi:hypothetical protein
MCGLIGVLPRSLLYFCAFFRITPVFGRSYPAKKAKRRMLYTTTIMPMAKEARA